MSTSNFDSCDAINDVDVIRSAIATELLGATDREAAYAKVFGLISATFSNQALIKYLLDTELEVLEDEARADVMWATQRPKEEAAKSKLAKELEQVQASLAAATETQDAVIKRLAAVKTARSEWTRQYITLLEESVQALLHKDKARDEDDFERIRKLDRKLHNLMERMEVITENLKHAYGEEDDL